MNKNPMNALSIEEVFEHETFKRIRTLTELSGNGGEPQIWFVARDVCAALGFKDAGHAIKRHVEREDTAKRRIFFFKARKSCKTLPCPLWSIRPEHIF